jgi:hypothetical protein
MGGYARSAKRKAVMKALIEQTLVEQIGRDRQRTSSRRARRASSERSDQLVIRSAAADDRGPLRNLALLDSATLADGPMLVAEQDGMLVAAVPLRGGRAIADPFVPSANIVSILELRRNQLCAAA